VPLKGIRDESGHVLMIIDDIPILVWIVHETVRRTQKARTHYLRKPAC
jgi:hypothetical protein